MLVSFVLRKEEGALKNACEEVSRIGVANYSLIVQMLPWPILRWPES